MKRANIKDVAKLAGVSTATVSHVINGTRFVEEATEKRVRQVMTTLQYIPSHAGRLLRSQKSKTIALLVPIMERDTSSSFFMSIAQVIEKVLINQGYHLILANSYEDIKQEKAQLLSLCSKMIDGLIFAPTGNDYSYLKEIFPENFPIVFIDRKPATYSDDTTIITVDDSQAIYKVLSLFKEKGRKRISYISGIDDVFTSRHRLYEYKKSIDQLGYKKDDSLILIEKPSFEAGANLAEKLLSRGVDAILVGNNVMALGAVSILNKSRVKIPEDISFVCFDDYYWTLAVNPPLTVIKQPVHKIGSAAAETILKQIRENTRSINRIELEAELLIRESI